MEAGANGHGTLAGKGRRRWFGAQNACRHYRCRTGALQATLAGVDQDSRLPGGAVKLIFDARIPLHGTLEIDFLQKRPRQRQAADFEAWLDLRYSISSRFEIAIIQLADAVEVLVWKGGKFRPRAKANHAPDARPRIRTAFFKLGLIWYIIRVASDLLSIYRQAKPSHDFSKLVQCDRCSASSSCRGPLFDSIPWATCEAVRNDMQYLHWLLLRCCTAVFSAVYIRSMLYNAVRYCPARNSAFF